MSWNFCKNTADVTLKFELALLSRGEVSTKIRGHSIHSLQNMTFPYITSWNFCKNVIHLMKSLENLNCHFYQEVNFLQKVRHFCWCNLKIRPAPFITSKNFRKNKAVFLKRFELHQLSRAGIFSKMRQFWWYLLKFDLPL